MAATESPNTLVSNQRVRIIDVLSEGTIEGYTPVSGASGTNPLCSVYFDDIPVLNGDGSPNWNISGQGFAFAFNSGTSGQDPLVGFEKVEAFIPLPSNTRVFLPPRDNGLNGYPKEVVATLNTTTYPDAEGVKISLRFPALYTVDPTTGNTKGYNIRWAIDIATNNGPYVELDNMSLLDVVSAPKCTSPYLYTKVYTLPKNPAGQTFYEWRIRVRRVTANVMSTNTQNEMFVDSIAIISSNTYRYPMTAISAFNMTADQFGSLPSRAHDIRGIRVLVPDGYTPTAYNVDETITAASYPGVWLGTMTERKWTDNPAWIFYDLVTNKRYGLGKYVRSDWVDKWTLYQIAQYCDEMVDDGKGGLEPRFTCNVAITESQEAYTLLNNLVSVFRGMLYWANGRIFPVGSEDRDSVFNFTNANVIGGAFNYADTPRNTRATVCMVKWLDPENLFRPTPERVEDIDGIGKYGYIPKTITAFATTSRGQAIRAANWYLTVEQILTETITFQTDMGGIYLRPGDVFSVYDNYRNNQQQGGRLLGWGTGQQVVYLDKPTTLEPGYTYFLSALVPAANLIATGDITGSNQISLIRNSQLETRRVLTASPAANVSTLELTSGFSSALFKGSPWTLSASGSDVTVFDQASLYKCLATNEPSRGIVEIVGVQYSTGINYRVNTTYSAEVSAPIFGDTTAPAAPTGIKAHRVTGIRANNNFFDYTYVSWTASTSTNAAYYTLSGQLGAGVPYVIQQVSTTGVNYTPPSAGTYTFSVAAANANGYQSAFNRTTYVKANTNPLGVTAPLGRLFIMSGADVNYIRGSDAEYTGYIGTTPTFAWNLTLDTLGNEIPSAQFITGYRVRLLKLGDESTVLSPTDISLSGRSNRIYTLPASYLYSTATVKPLRGFTFSVDTVDRYGNVVSGARLPVNNPQLPPPVNSGFLGFNGGLIYTVTPANRPDTSGLYLWTHTGTSFTPTYNNVDYITTTLGGNAPIGPVEGNVYTWFALVDSFGFSGSASSAGDMNAPIYGPVSGNANQIFQTFAYDITDQLSGAFDLLTGMITDSTSVTSGNAMLALQTVQGLSGQITGNGTIPGAANTALNVRVNTAVGSSSGALSSQIDAVSARVVQTGINNYALAGTVMDALATTGGALTSWITNLSSSTTGVNASIKIGAQAFVTGDTNGLGGAAVATWGFSLDANGKVVSMRATSSSSTFGQPATFGTIVFGNADLQSSTYSAATAGWKISANGDVEFNNGTFRGSVKFQEGGQNQVVITGEGFRVGSIGALAATAGYTRIWNAFDFGTLSTNPRIDIHADNNRVVAQLMTSLPGDGGSLYLNPYTSNASTIALLGSVGSISGYQLNVGQFVRSYGPVTGADIVATTTTSPRAFMRGSDGQVSGQFLNVGLGGGGAAVSNFGGIRYSGGNTNVIGFAWVGSNLRAYVDGSFVGNVI